MPSFQNTDDFGLVDTTSKFCGPVSVKKNSTSPIKTRNRRGKRKGNSKLKWHFFLSTLEVKFGKRG